MSVATSTAIAIGAGVSAAGALGGAALSSSAAGNAAKTQSNAALTAAQLQHQDAQQALQFQEQQYNTGQSELAPWLQSGQSALSNLNYLLGIGPNPTAQPAPGAPVPAAGGALPAAANSTGLPRPTAPVQTPAATARLATMGGLAGGTPGTGSTLTHPGLTPTTLATPGVGAQAGALAPLTTGQGAASNPSAYGGSTFNQLVGSGNPQISPDAATTASWKAQGVPFQNITTSDGRTVAVRTDNPTASVAPPTGIQPSSAAQINPDLGAYGSLSKGWDQTFQAPTGLTEQNDPGYQARLNLGETALNNSAAARGGLLTGGTARDVNQFAQDYASNEYGNVYNRALNTYGTNYNTFEANQANQYNRLASLAGIGQQTASQLNTSGLNTGNNIANTLLTSGAQTGQQLNNAAAATASGYVGSANAYGGALSGIGGNLSNLASLYSLLNQNQGLQQVPTVSNYGGLTG